MDKTTDQRLIDAANLLAEFAAAHLPPDYRIKLEFSADESDLSLESPDGDDLEVATDCGSHFRLACDEAREHAKDGVDAAAAEVSSLGTQA